LIKQVLGAPEGFDNTGPMNPDYLQVKISSGRAQYLSPTILGSNITILSQVASTAGLWNSTMPSAPYYSEIIIENIIAPLVANGISRASYNTSLLMSLNGATDPHDLWLGGEWMADILPKGGKMGPGGNAFNISTTEKSRSTMFKMVATVNGYAYSSDGLSQKVQNGRPCVLYPSSIVANLLPFDHGAVVIKLGFWSRDSDASDEFGGDSA
jgi:hypothetical protein